MIQTTLAPGAPWPYHSGYIAAHEPVKTKPTAQHPKRDEMEARAEHILSIIKESPMHARELDRRLRYSRHAIERTLAHLTRKRLAKKVFTPVGRGDSFVFNYEAV